MIETSTKAKILSAARTLFTTHGFAGTSVGKIAKLAEVNHSLIFHHFQNKEQLWVAVKHSIVEEAGAQTLPDTHLSFEDFLKELFNKNKTFYRQNPDLIRMINWQRLEHSNNKQIGITDSNDIKKWIQAIKHYQKTGDIQPDLKPEFIITLILSIISSAALDPNVFIQNNQSQDEYISFCIQQLKKLS